MVLNVMMRGRGATDFTRMQYVSKKRGLHIHGLVVLVQLYKTHDFSMCVLVFTFDGRHCPHKIRNAASRQQREAAIRARDVAKTYLELERELKKLVTIDTDIICLLGT